MTPGTAVKTSAAVRVAKGAVLLVAYIMTDAAPGNLDV